MADAEFKVAFAGPLVTLQDAGRPGRMRFGAPRSGPMDRLAFDAAHAALGRTEGAAIEVSLGGVALECVAGEITVAIMGGDFVVEHQGRKRSGWTVLTVRKGERLTVRGGASGSWAYIAFAGDLVAPKWLGAAATHSTSGFGAGALAAGRRLAVADAAVHPDREGDALRPEFQANGPIRVVLGPQDQHFAPGAVETFLSSTYAVSDAYDRMGMRLDGPRLSLDGALSIPSEPILRGCLQVSGDGVPTLLGADHQTTGGYPKIATVASSDLDRVAQARSGDRLRFTSVSAEDALELLGRPDELREVRVARCLQRYGGGSRGISRTSPVGASTVPTPSRYRASAWIKPRKEARTRLAS